MITGFAPVAGSEDARQLGLLSATVGVPGSGYVRYGAAMYFFQKGLIAADLLEIYRICCKLDGEDPVAVAKHDGIIL